MDAPKRRACARACKRLTFFSPYFTLCRIPAFRPAAHRPRFQVPLTKLQDSTPGGGRHSITVFPPSLRPRSLCSRPTHRFPIMQSVLPSPVSSHIPCDTPALSEGMPLCANDASEHHSDADPLDEPPRNAAKRRQPPPLSPPRRKSARRMRTSPVTPPPLMPSSVGSTPTSAARSAAIASPPPPPQLALTSAEAQTLAALELSCSRSQMRLERVHRLHSGTEKSPGWPAYAAMRARLVQALVRACGALRLGHATLHGAASLLDRLAGSITLPSGVLPLAAGACALLAAKTQQTAAEMPALADFAAVCAQPTATLARMELVALDALDWRLDVVVAPHFLVLFRTVAERAAPSADPRERAAFDVAHCALDLALYEPGVLLAHHPRLLAAAAWAAARRHCGLLPVCPPRITAVSGVIDGLPLRTCFAQLAALLDAGWQ